MVVTVRALKRHGGIKTVGLNLENVEAVQTGLNNLQKHVENMAAMGVPAIIAINRFEKDTESEIQAVLDYCCEASVPAAVTRVFGEGTEGGIDLAEAVLDALPSRHPDHRPFYDLSLSTTEKIEKIAKGIYGAQNVVFSRDARVGIKRLANAGFGDLPVCIAKTQYSLSDNPRVLGRPDGHSFTVREVRVAAGAGFIVALSGDMLTMPGLPEYPSAEEMVLNRDGTVIGLG